MSDSVKSEIQARFNAAKELLAGGEAIHQTFGELSISLERLLTTSTEIITQSDGTKIEKSKKWDGVKDRTILLDRYFAESEILLEQLYRNQHETRVFILQIALIIGFVVTLIFFVKPVVLAETQQIRNDRFILSKGVQYQRY